MIPVKHLLLLLPLTIWSCQSDKTSLPGSLEDKYFEATKSIDACSDLLNDYLDHKTFEKFLGLQEKSENLKFDYDDAELNEEQYQKCRSKKLSMDSIKREMRKVLEEDLSLYDVSIAQASDKLIQASYSTPFQANRGEDLKLTATADNALTFKIYNADSRKVIYDSHPQRQIEHDIHIANTAIYLLEIKCKTPSYLDFSLTKKASSIKDFTQTAQVLIDTIACEKGDFRSQKVEGVQLKNLFEEPRKITLRSQGKALFSGSTRSLVAVNIPSSTADIMYNLRISTSDTDRSSDGEFYDRTNQRYHQIKFLGLPIYESSRNNNSLLRELLSVTKPDREEEAYCSMYVFKTAGEARKFQNNKPINSLQYNLDYTIVGTQSCNGRIPVKDMKTLYLGFDNPKMTSSVYIWLEVIGAVRTTEYFKEKYKLVTDR